MMRWFRWRRGVRGGRRGGHLALGAGRESSSGVASYLVGSNRGDVRVDVAMASMAAFLFGVLLAFTIVRTRERLALVQDLVAKGNSSLFSIHQMMSVFGEEDRRRVRDLVDRHLTDQIDYRLVDYHLATPSYLDLTDAVYALDPEGPQQEAVYKELVALCITMSTDRVPHRGGDRTGAVRHRVERPAPPAGAPGRVDRRPPRRDRPRRAGRRGAGGDARHLHDPAAQARPACAGTSGSPSGSPPHACSAAWAVTPTSPAR